MSAPFSELYAEVYDALYAKKDYAAESDILEGLFGEFGALSPANILDLGCGTGNHSRELVLRGHAVLGVDRSPAMLDRARKKAPGAEFLQGDVATLDLGRSFDVVLLMFAVFGYQTTDAQALSTLQAAARHLTPGGLLVFDVWYQPAVLALGPEPRRLELELSEGRRLVRTATPTLDAERGVCRVSYQLQLFAGEELLQQTSEDHLVRFFSAEELDRLLLSAGFLPLRLRAFPDVSEPPSESTWNVVAVARRK